ncbi:radical SAM protein [candidate division KSB1 bacterium]|nr:radical SAM protein [candidate division KSB1 bacterium]
MVDLRKEIIYGPLESDRLGNYLGVNLLPTHFKLCPYNCVYCGHTSPGLYPIDLHEFEDEIPAVDTVLEQLEAGLKKELEIDYLFFCGQGEPTVHPRFREIIAGVAQLRDELAPSLDICVLSNGAWLNREEIAQAFSLVDVPIFKLDVGLERLWKKIYRPMTGLKFKEVIAGMQTQKRFYLQSVFFEGSVHNSDEENLEAWADLVGDLKPVSVQLFTLQERPGKKAYRPLALPRLHEIGQYLQEKTGVPYCVYRTLEENNGVV